MDKRPLLVAGIDPGTTIGFCLLDLGGKIVVLQSSKQLSLSKLIEKAADTGRVVLVGCDRKKIPELVERFAAKFGARVVSPDHDLLTAEKKQLVGDKKTKDSHEFDALASAFFTLKEISPLLRKIRVFVKNYHKEQIFERIAEITIREGVGIRLAADIVESPEKEEVKLVKRVVTEDTVSRKRVLQLYESLAKERDSVQVLKKQNTSLREELQKLRSLTKYLHKKISHLGSEEKSEEILRLKKEQVNNLRNQLAGMVSEIEELKRDLSGQRELIPELSNRVLVKKLKNIGSEEFEKKSKFLKIRKGDVLLVDNPSIVSHHVIQKIRKLNSVLITKKRMSQRLVDEIDVPVVSAADIKLNETRYFASADAQEIEKIRTDKTFLEKLVRQYQASRK